MSLADLSILELARLLRAGSVSSREIVADALDRIAERDRQIHAFIRVEAEAALGFAGECDAELARGVDRGPLHGIPYALKDIYDVAGLPTTCHSKLRLDAIATADSAVAERLRQGGAVLLGKLATHEFAFGGPSFDLPFPPARNPLDPDRITGGSSSGSAAAVAAGFVRFAPGSCSGGSLRGPAAWCGVVGLKPTYGRVSRRGVFPLAWTLDHCGPIARTVEDAAVALQAMAGHDAADPGSADVPVPDFTAALEAGVKGLRIGVPRHFFRDHAGLSDEASGAIEAAIARLRAADATVADVELPEQRLFAACGRVVMTAEMFSIHQEHLRTRLADYGQATVNRFVLGATVGAADYINAQRLRSKLKAAVDETFQQYDALLTVISLSTAPRFDTAPNASAWGIQANAFNVTGHPAISVPVGLAADGMPLAVQVIGRAFDEATALRIAKHLESCA
ncbi:MAG: amidase [Rhizobiaceae bacterium]|nr:amidase [Rhizobiaceae bacterium]